MGAQLDQVIADIQTLNANLAAIAQQKQLLDDYKTQKQNYSDLVVQVKANLDSLTQANTAALKTLAADITAAFP